MSYTKILIAFKEIFWPKHVPFIGLIFNQSTSPPDCPLKCLVLDNLYAQRGVPVIEISLVAEYSQWLKTRSKDEIKGCILSCIQRGLMGPNGPVDVASMCVRFDITTEWDEDPYSRGSYSGPTINSSYENFEQLSIAEWGGKLRFIGEATSTTYMGSVHGALLSGFEFKI